MTAHIYWGKAWRQARELRAGRGKAPRLAVHRAILLRQGKSGLWVAAIHERRFGCWKSPTILCGWTGLDGARKAALEAWESHRLPLMWSYNDERGLRPFYQDLNEPDMARLNALVRGAGETRGKAA